MKYFFVLGTNPALSIAELNSVIDLSHADLVSADFLICDINEIEPFLLMKKLGGTIKIGRILEELPANSHKELLDYIIKIAKGKQAKGAGGKFNFGFSSYGLGQFNKKDFGLKLKKSFSDQKISSRFVVSQEKTLSSVVVEMNKMINKGIEIILADFGGKTLVGETLAVQPFKDLSRRDFGRPARDDLSGMIPPKLAQIMINLANIEDADDLVLDPFCGSGTILGELLLAGHKNIFGLDISPKAIDDTKANISWIKELYAVENVKMKFLVKNVLSLSLVVKNNSVSAIITEPYLGPQRGMINFEVVIRDLESLYAGAINGFYQALKPGGRVVMVWPSFYGQRPINPNYNGFEMLNMLPKNLENSQFIKKNNRNSIIYGRPGQKVFREIIVLEKK